MPADPRKLEILKWVLARNGYDHFQKKRAINKSLQIKSTVGMSKPEEIKYNNFLPYIKVVTDKISRTLKNRYIRTIFIATTNLPTQFELPRTQFQLNLTVSTKYIVLNITDLTHARPIGELTTGYMKISCQFVKPIEHQHFINITVMQDKKWILRTKNHIERNNTQSSNHTH